MPDFSKAPFSQTVWETTLPVPLENKSPAPILRGFLMETHLVPTAWQEGWGVIFIFFPALIYLWLFLPAPCLSAAVQTSSCSAWPIWKRLVQVSWHKQVLSKDLFIFTCLIVFVHLILLYFVFYPLLGNAAFFHCLCCTETIPMPMWHCLSFLSMSRLHVSFLPTSALPLAACGWLCLLPAQLASWFSGSQV